MLETVPILFEDFANKFKIIQCINHLPITRNTVKYYRTLNIAENITNQQITDFKLCSLHFLFCFDESTAIIGSARLSVFIRYFFGNEIKNELVLVSLQETSKGFVNDRFCYY